MNWRRAVAVLPVVGGVAVLDPRVPSSYEHNALWLTGAVDAETVIDDIGELFEPDNDEQIPPPSPDTPPP